MHCYNRTNHQKKVVRDLLNSGSNDNFLFFHKGNKLVIMHKEHFAPQNTESQAASLKLRRW